jgi:homogentisate 1,2-dioxygenase
MRVKKKNYFLVFLGANGLANPRDFQTPTGDKSFIFTFLIILFFSLAYFEDRQCDFTVIHKFQGSLFQSRQVDW